MPKKLSLRPPAKKSETQEMAEFIQAASSRSTEEGTLEKPWEHPKVRDDVIKAVSLRMPEPYIIRLQYLAEKTHKSQQELLREVVLPWLEMEVEKY